MSKTKAKARTSNKEAKQRAPNAPTVEWMDFNKKKQ